MGEIYVTLKTVRRRKITLNLLVIIGEGINSHGGQPSERVTGLQALDVSHKGHRLAMGPGCGMTTLPLQVTPVSGSGVGAQALVQAELWTGSVTLSWLLRSCTLSVPGLPTAGARPPPAPRPTGQVGEEPCALGPAPLRPGPSLP